MTILTFLLLAAFIYAWWSALGLLGICIAWSVLILAANLMVRS